MYVETHMITRTRASSSQRQESAALVYKPLTLLHGLVKNLVTLPELVRGRGQIRSGAIRHLLIDVFDKSGTS